MKRFVKCIILLLIIFISLHCKAYSSDEFLVQEMLENPQTGEVNLDVNTDTA